MLYSKNQWPRSSRKEKVAFPKVFKPRKNHNRSFRKERTVNLDKTEFKRWGKLKGILFTNKAAFSGTYSQENYFLKNPELFNSSL